MCANSLNSFLTLIVNDIFASSHSRVLLKIVILFYMYLGNSRGGVHFQQSCRYYVSRFGGGGLLRGCFSNILFIYCVNCCFMGKCWFIILSTLFILPTWKENSLERALEWIFDKYLVLYQLFIKHQLCIGNLQSFPSQMTNLLTQYFY